MAGPGQEVAHGRIVVTLDDRADRDLERIERDFRRTMAAIERERATVDINANVDDLKKDLKEARSAVTRYEKEVEAEENKRSKAQKQRHLEKLKRIEREAAAAVTAANKEKKAHVEETKALRLAQKEIDAITKKEENRARVFERTHQQYMRNLQAEARRRATLAGQREREFRADERQAHQMEQSRARELAMIPKLQRSYAELESRLVKLAATRRRARGDTQALTVIDLKERETISDMHRLRSRLQSIGEEPISIHVELDRGTRSGNFIREAFKRGGIHEASRAAGIAAGVSLGSGVERGFRRAFSKGIVTDVVNAGFRGFGRLGGLLEGLSNVTVRLGPFTATIRQLAVAMTLFAPILVDVIGALGSMVSVAGAATLGVGALATGLIGGAIPALIGVGTVLKPMVTQLKDVTALSKSYNKAVLQYGEGSDQAKTKLKQLNHALGSVDAQTRRAFVSAGTLADRWADLTSDSRASAFHILGRGLDFLNGGLEGFAENTNKTFDVVEKATDRWFDGLESAEGRQIIDTMWDNFNDALGPALDGLGNVATYLGRIGAVASEFLPGVMRGFRNWSQGLADSAADADNLRGRIRGVVDAARSFGDFLLSGGRLLRTFFAGGVGPGINLLDTMTNAFQRWNAALQTTQGQQDLAGFFERAVSGAQALYSFLAPIVQTFTQWATMLSPFSAAFFSVTGAIISFVGALSRVAFLQGPIQALVATLGALWAVGKISAATTAVSNFAAALFGMGRATTAVAVGQTAAAAATTRVAASGAIAQGAFAATGAAAAKSGAQVGVLRATANALIPSLAGAGAIAGGIATAGLFAVGGAAAYGFFKLATARTESEKLRDEFNSLGQQSQSAGKAIHASETQLGNVGGAAQRAALNLKMARQRLGDAKKGTDEYKLALLDYRDAQRYAIEAQQQWNTLSKNYVAAGRDRNKIDEKRKSLLKDIREEEKRLQDDTLQGRLGKRNKEELEAQQQRLADLRQEYARLTAQSEHAANAQAASALNVKRGWLGLAPVLGQAKQQLGALARQSRGIAARIAVKFDAPKDVGRVAAQASRALKSGVPGRIVTRIVVNSKDAEQALNRLQRYTINRKELFIIEHGGKQAIAMIERIIGRKLTPKEQRIAQRGGEQTIAMLEGIIRKKIGDKNFSIRANDFASGVINSVSSMLAGLNGKTANTYVNTYHRNFGGTKTNAGGGLSSSSSVPVAARAAVNRELDRAERGRTPILDRAATQRGRKITGPTLLTGEEHRSEFVIATNPRYRRSNIKHWQNAGRMLGVMPAATGFDSGGVGGEGYYAPNTKIGVARPTPMGTVGKKGIRKRARKPKKRRKTYARQDAWANYVAGLHTQQEDWEREVSIREQGVIEPDSFIKEVSRTPDVTLPDGTVQKGIPTYDIDQGAVALFTSQLQEVYAGYQKLIDITKELVFALPRALNAADVEWRVRDVRAEKFKDARNKHRKLAKATKDDKVKDFHNKKADQADKALQAERDEQHKLGDNMRDYRADRKEAGFDEREFRLSRDDYGRQIDAVAGRAQEQKTNENESASGGSSGSGGSTAVSGAVQLGLVDQAKYEVLKEFAGNFGALGATPATSGGGVGGLANLARNPVVAGAAIGGAIAGGGGFGGTSTSSILSAGTAAGSAVAQPTSVSGSSPTGLAPATGGDKSVTVNNYYEEQPADPHTWSANTAFELGALI